MRWAAALICAIPCTVAAEAPPRLPSGQPVSLIEVIWPQPGAQEPAARFRFLAPKLKKGEGNTADMKTLCERLALPALKEKGAGGDRIVISLSSQPVKFGEARPDVTQVIEAFTAKAGKCEEAEPW